MDIHFPKRRTVGEPILPIGAYSWLYDHYGEAIAVEILDRVQEGRYTVGEVSSAIREGSVEALLNARFPVYQSKFSEMVHKTADGIEHLTVEAIDGGTVTVKVTQFAECTARMAADGLSWSYMCGVVERNEFAEFGKKMYYYFNPEEGPDREDDFCSTSVCKLPADCASCENGEGLPAEQAGESENDCSRCIDPAFGKAVFDAAEQTDRIRIRSIRGMTLQIEADWFATYRFYVNDYGSVTYELEFDTVSRGLVWDFLGKVGGM